MCLPLSVSKEAREERKIVSRIKERKNSIVPTPCWGTRDKEVANTLSYILYHLLCPDRTTSQGTASKAAYVCVCVWVDGGAAPVKAAMQGFLRTLNLDVKYEKLTN